VENPDKGHSSVWGESPYTHFERLAGAGVVSGKIAPSSAPATPRGYREAH